MEQGLQRIIASCLFNILVFDFNNLNYLHGSETSLSIFDIKPNGNDTFYNLFPSVDIDLMKKEHNNQSPFMGSINLLEDYSTKFYKVEIFNFVYLVLITSVIVLEDDFSKQTDYTTYAVARLDNKFKFVETDNLFNKRFGEAIGRCFNCNFINSFDVIFKKNIENNLSNTGHYQGVIPLECINGRYYEHFVIIDERKTPKGKFYDVSYYPYEEFGKIGKIYLADDLKHDFILSTNPNMYSKEKFFQVVTKSLIEKGDNPCYLIFIDINDFKSINDRYGHLQGDFVIKEIGNILAYVFRNHLVSSYGGDEFAIFIEKETDLRKIINKINKAEKMINESIRFKPINTKTFLCAGISRTPINGTTIYDLIKEADIKMYHAKEKEELYCVGFQEE